MATNPNPASSSAERRRRSRNQRIPPVEVRLNLSGDPPGEWKSAVVTDISESGIGIQSLFALTMNAALVLEASDEMLAAIGPVAREGRVAWCRRTNSGLYRSGIAFPKTEEVKPGELPAVDYYEVLQVHPKAGPDTLSRVYRLLAQRYHPDNTETGDTEAFRLLTQAYRVLSDPEQRAAYDLQHAEADKSRWRLCRAAAEGTGPQAETEKRRAVLSLLYHKRCREPEKPAMTIFEVEELLGIPREQLEFTLWYLKERHLIGRGDNNRFQITADGVDRLESMEERAGVDDIARARQLPSPASEEPASGKRE